jgi:hypothetical protein
MAHTVLTRDWRRFHDPAGEFIRPRANIHCIDGPADMIAFCRDRPRGTPLKAAGSHWALSEATVSEGDFVETNWPGPDAVPRNSGLALDMIALINDDLFQFMIDHPLTHPDKLARDPCLREGPGQVFYVHMKSGTLIYEAYSLLDDSPNQMTVLARELNNKLAGSGNEGAYTGPWGFETLGGAGGQTVFGALTTGTHGGDFQQRPVSDSVAAIHLVTDGGAHYWIEPASSEQSFPLTSDDKLNTQFANLVPGSPFEIIRDDDVFYSVLVGGGRFGIVSSVVLRVVPQYCLHEHRRLDSWREVKAALKTELRHHEFASVHFTGNAQEKADDIAAFTGRFGDPRNFSSRFLQVAINLSPNGDNDRICGVTQRWFYPQFGPEARDPNGEIRGRKERGLAGRTAGRSDAYHPPEDPDGFGTNTTFLSRACGSGNIIAGVLREIAKEIEEIVSDGAVPAAGIAAAALGIGAGAAVLAVAASICVILAAVALALKAIADAIEASGDMSLAEAINQGTDAVMNNPLIPNHIGLMILRAIFHEVFKSQQKNRDFVAINYAVMDGHDYLDRSCFGNAESIEVFFDAERPDLYCAYVDQILSFEAFQQEQHHRFSVGYVSLRYVRGSRALIAPSRFDQTLVIEVAAIRAASGSMDFVMNAAKIARHPAFNASFHWGQFNPLERHEVERNFGKVPGSRMDRWRTSLRALTDNGSRDGFSSNFTQRTGLEPF